MEEINVELNEIGTLIQILSKLKNDRVELRMKKNEMKLLQIANEGECLCSFTIKPPFCRASVSSTNAIYSYGKLDVSCRVACTKVIRRAQNDR